MHEEYSIWHVIGAILAGALAVVVGLALGNNATPRQINPPSTHITVNVPKDDVQPPVSYTPVPPAAGSSATTASACDLVSNLVTSDSNFVALAPESGVGNNAISCVLTDTNSAYSAIVQVQPDASSSDYYSALAADQNPNAADFDMTQGPTTYPNLGAINVPLAYQYSGLFNDGGAYTTTVFLANGLNGESYLVRTTVMQTFDNEPAPDANLAAFDAAMLLQ